MNTEKQEDALYRYVTCTRWAREAAIQHPAYGALSTAEKLEVIKEMRRGKDWVQKPYLLRPGA